MKLNKVISGGQTGADRGALKAAMAAGLKTGGWCPNGRRAEDGRIPDEYRLDETPSTDYPQRTEWNVRDSDATIVFTWGGPGRGSSLTAKFCALMKKPYRIIDISDSDEEKIGIHIAGFIRMVDPETLNVGGTRGSNAPGIEERVMQSILLLNKVKCCHRISR
jgi:hypothetical protein